MAHYGYNAMIARKLDELIVELHAYEEAFKTRKIAFFRPIAGTDQEKFFAGQTANGRVVLGSNRSGKTVCGVNEAIAHSLGYRPWLPVDHPLRTVRLCDGRPIPVPNVGRVIAQNYEQAIRQTIMPKFDEWGPREFIKRIEKNTRGIPVALEWTNGSIIHLMSNDQDDMAFEGPMGHWFWGDEPFDQRKFVGLRRGLVDTNGHYWMTMTPLSQPWINDTLVSRAGDPGSGIELYRFSIWDNCRDRGGHLERSAIESFLADLSESDLEARLHGNFLHLAGLVYKTWEPRVPYWIPPFELPESWPRVMFCDPHGRKPLALMWGAVSPADILYVYRAVFDRNIKTIADAASYIKTAENWASERHPGPRAEPVAMRIIDWSAEEEERTSGMSIRRAFHEQGLLFHKAHKQNAAYGYDMIHEQLKIRREWEQPGLVVFNTCGPVKQNFMNFCHDSWGTSKQEQIKGPKEGYISNHDDFIDLIRYYYQQKLGYHALRSMLRRQQDESNFEFSPYGMHERDGTRTGYGMSLSTR